MDIIIMSNNKKKLEELQTLMADPGYQITSYRNVLATPLDVIEDGDTFEANALKKVTAIKPEALPNPTQTIIIADDSGLEVDALDNRPGIHSARYGGKNLTDTQRCQALLTELGTTTNRNARFVCVIALRFPNGTTKTQRGIVEGTITTTLSGDQGFGYDPIFIPTGYTKSFAVLGKQVKSQMSHRTQALQKVKDLIYTT